MTQVLKVSIRTSRTGWMRWKWHQLLKTREEKHHIITTYCRSSAESFHFCPCSRRIVQICRLICSSSDNWVSYFAAYVRVSLCSVKTIRAKSPNTSAEVKTYSPLQCIDRCCWLLCVCVFRCTNDWQGHTLHNQTSTICLPTQGTSSPLPPPPSLLFCAFTLWGIKSLFQSNSHPHAAQSLLKTKQQCYELSWQLIF